jgi:surface protein
VHQNLFRRLVQLVLPSTPVRTVAEYNYPGNQGTFGEMKCWDVSSITDMSSLFYYSQLNEPIGCWNVSSVTTMFGMFESATNFNQPIENWNVGSVTNMYGMFYDATMV